MTIVLLGNHRVSFTSESHYKRSLEVLGHTVIALQETEVNATTVYEIAKHADVFVWVHTHGWHTEGSMTDVLDKLKAEGVPTVAYHLDLYMPLPQRWNEYVNSDYMNRLQYFFTTDKQMADWLNNSTQTKGIYLPAGVYDKEAVMLPQQSVKHKVVFTGSKQYHSEWPYRPKLVNWLEDTYGADFGHYGNDGIKVVRGLELNQVYADSLVAVGDTLCPNFNYPNQFSDRLFESTGRGAFTIFPYIKGIEEHFEIGKEIVTYKFDDFGELKHKIDYYIEHDDEREAIRKAGHERTKRDHTYSHRWQKIIQEVTK